MNRRQLTRVTSAALLALLSPWAAAQDIPKKTLTLVVGFAAGGAADTAARVVAKKLGDNLGQTLAPGVRGFRRQSRS